MRQLLLEEGHESLTMQWEQREGWKRDFMILRISLHLSETNRVKLGEKQERWGQQELFQWRKFAPLNFSTAPATESSCFCPCCSLLGPGSQAGKRAKWALPQTPTTAPPPEKRDPPLTLPQVTRLLQVCQLVKGLAWLLWNILTIIPHL